MTRVAPSPIIAVTGVFVVMMLVVRQRAMLRRFRSRRLDMNMRDMVAGVAVMHRVRQVPTTGVQQHAASPMRYRKMAITIKS
jgi:hypothetical protein